MPFLKCCKINVQVNIREVGFSCDRKLLLWSQMTFFHGLAVTLQLDKLCRSVPFSPDAGALRTGGVDPFALLKPFAARTLTEILFVPL
jgi:hypothetical protein